MMFLCKDIVCVYVGMCDTMPPKRDTASSGRQTTHVGDRRSFNRAAEGVVGQTLGFVAFKGFVPHYDRGIQNADRGAETRA